MHSEIIERILKDHPASTIKSLSTGGLKSLNPDGSWNLIIAKAAQESKEFQEYRRHYPNHKSKKSDNDIMVDLLLQTQAHGEFKNMLGKHNLKFEIHSVEKVFYTETEQGDRVIDDAGMFWWRPI